MKTISDVQSATDAELIAFWNQHNPQKQFDRMTIARPKFEDWCVELIAELTEEEANGIDSESVEAQSAGVAVSAGVAALQSMANGGQLNFAKDVTGTVKAPTGTVHKVASDPVARQSNASGVSASWGDADVAAARLKRDGVRVIVDGVTSDYKSVNEAFRELKLPVQKHIRFRGKLKASRAEVFEHDDKKYHFSIV